MMGGGGCRILLYGRKEGRTRSVFFSCLQTGNVGGCTSPSKKNGLPLFVTYAHQTPGEKRKLDLLLVFCLISPPLD